ncbi:initiator trna phosphoribosyl transferase protein [Apiospora saccharicola]|uniref:Initiator trna phosphoribosyl transferase protein n=1 Tax=Apiospora saccharicola TaxID=335842 RepID=A0ABR1TJM7_9PEZI
MAAVGSETSSGAAPLTEADLIFSPQANHNFSRILGDLKKSNLSITNRLRSIKEDAHFVSEAAEALGRPLIANERCGSWYISPDDKAGSAYFKSTDGHMGQWSFSTRRLNLHLLSVIGKNDGKTIPTWCCVLNRALFPEVDGDEHDLFTPPHVVSESEHAQMQAKIPDFVEALGSLHVDVASLRKQVKKPLRPFWLTRESQIETMAEIFEEFHPVICLTSSRRVQGGEMSEGGYIQGAGDDTENWALGLTPTVFWQNEKMLLSTSEPDLPELVKSLVATHAATSGGPTPKQLTDNLYVGARAAESPNPTTTCTITIVPQTTEPSEWVKNSTCMEVGLGKQYKLASRNLRTALPQICDFVAQCLAASPSTSPTTSDVLIRCESGKDVSVGIALALLCRVLDDDGNYKPKGTEDAINKSGIKVKLGRVMTRFPEATPSRATLQSVNSFLMG